MQGQWRQKLHADELFIVQAVNPEAAVAETVHGQYKVPPVVNPDAGIVETACGQHKATQAMKPIAGIAETAHRIMAQ